MTTQPDNNTKPASPRRRWYQFSLRTLLVLMLVLPIGLGWYAHARNKSLKQWEAVRALRAAGEKLRALRDDELLEGEQAILPAPAWQKAMGVDLPQELKVFLSRYSKFTDAEAAHLAELPQVTIIQVRGETTDKGTALITKRPKLECLTLNSPHLTDESLKILADFRDLEVLDIRTAPITDQGLAYFSNHPKLTFLAVDSPLITDKGLASVATCAKLEQLFLQSNEITDAGMASMSSLKQLKALSVSSFRITDAGLEPLAAIKTLETVRLVGTQASPDGIAKLQQAIPSLKIFVQ